MIERTRTAFIVATFVATSACNAILDIETYPPGPVNDAGLDAAEATQEAGKLDALPAIESSSEAPVDSSADVIDGGFLDSEASAESSSVDAEVDALEASSNACSTGDTRCVGSAVQSCSDGQWMAALPCDAGACNGAGICGVCADGDSKCYGYQLQACTNGDWGTAAPCGGAKACTGTSCALQLTVTGASVTATQTLAVTGPVALVSDAFQLETSATLTAQVSWGDGTSNSGVVSGGNGSFTVSGSHTYGISAPPMVTIVVVVNAMTGASASVAYPATVRPAATGVVSQFQPTESYDIAIGPDGNVWLTEEDHGIDMLTAAGVSTNYVSPVLTEGIVAGPDGNLWYTASDSNVTTGFSIGSMTTVGVNGARTAISGYADRYSPNGITVGSDGNIWFTENQGMIGRVTLAGELKEFPASGDPGSIVSSPDGYLWFTESMGGKIGRIAASTGAILEFPLPTSGFGPDGIALGPDGNIWFTESAASVSKVGRLDPSTATFTEFTLPSGVIGQGIAVGPDRNLWVTLSGNGPVCRITTTGALTVFPPSAGFNFADAIAGPDKSGSMWFVEDLSNVGEISP